MYGSQNIIRVNKQRMRWEGHVASMGETRNAYKVLVRKQKGRDHVEELGVDGRIILKCILGKQVGNVWTGC
jgi:hypothetical protein